MKKNVGTRTRAKARTLAQQRQHRAEQAARAILAGRGDHEANWNRIARCFPDLASADHAYAFAAGLGVGWVPAHLVEAAFPPAPEQEPVAEEPSPADVGALLALAEMPNDPPAGETAAA